MIARTRPAVSATALLILGVVGTGVARADCNADFAVLMGKRTGEIEALNRISKANGGKLDPVAACPRLRSLASVEREVVGYITKNKEWCGLPDDLAEKMTATQSKTAALAGKACNFAVKMKQMQAEAQKQAQQGPQPQALQLPTGPL